MACPPTPSVSAGNCEWAAWANACPDQAKAQFGGVFGQAELASLNLACSAVDLLTGSTASAGANLDAAAAGATASAAAAVNATASTAAGLVSAAAAPIVSKLWWLILLAAAVAYAAWKLRIL